VHSIVGDKTDRTPRTVALSVDCRIVVGDGRKKCVARLILVFLSDGSVCYRGLENGAVFPCKIERALQGQAHRGRILSCTFLLHLGRRHRSKKQRGAETKALKFERRPTHSSLPRKATNPIFKVTIER